MTLSWQQSSQGCGKEKNEPKDKLCRTESKKGCMEKWHLGWPLKAVQQNTQKWGGRAGPEKGTASTTDNMQCPKV